MSLPKIPHAEMQMALFPSWFLRMFTSRMKRHSPPPATANAPVLTVRGTSGTSVLDWLYASSGTGKSQGIYFMSELNHALEVECRAQNDGCRGLSRDILNAVLQWIVGRN
jgi:hypothetical protein